MTWMISRYAIFEDLFLRRSSPATQKLKEALISLYAAILLYLSKAKAFFLQSKPKRVLKSVFIDQEEFKELLTKVSLEQSEVDRCAAVVQAENQNSISDTLETVNAKSVALLDNIRIIDGPIHRMDAQLHSLEDRLEDSKRSEILSWISSQPYIEHHEQTKRSDVPERGKWLLDDPVYTQWHKDSACSLLWLRGKVGSGKSTLTAIVIDDALRRSEDGQSPPPVYFYCSRNAAEPDRSNPDAILASILRQLSCIQVGAPLRPSIIKKYETKGQGFTSHGLRLKESHDLILELIEQSTLITIVIDALDEIDSDKRHDLLQVLEEILREAVGLVKIFVSSRDDQEIECILDEYPSLNLTSDNNKRDIDLFVQTETERLIRQRRLLRYSRCKEELKSHIIEQVIKGADGMFRWVTLQLEVLCTFKLDADIRDTLGRLPPRLVELYTDIYEELISQKCGEAGRATIRNILVWLLFALRQMNSFELRTAVAIDLAMPVEELTKEHILDLCHNFVVFDDTLDTFRFAHLSVREFLETRAEYVPAACHILAAETCLIQLIGSTKSSTAKGFSNDEYAPDVFSKLTSTSLSTMSNFHEYSTHFWMEHCASIGEESRQSHTRFRMLFRYFLLTSHGDPLPLNAWIRSFRLRSYPYYVPRELLMALDEYSSPLSLGFILACFFGFCEILCESLGNPQISVEVKKVGWNMVCFGRQDEAMKTLLSQHRGYDIPPTFVKFAAQCMEPETLALILAQAPDTKLTPDLVEAASEMFSMKEFNNIDVLFNHYDASEVSEEILARAATELSGNKFQSLLDERGDIKVSASMFRRALNRGNHEVVNFLVNHQEFQLTATILEETVSLCDHEMLQIMLKRSAPDITPTTMRRAAMKEDSGVLEVLLKYGGTISHSVLTAAAAGGVAPVLRMLLDLNWAVTRTMLRVGARNQCDSKAVMILLLSEADDEMIREELNEMMKQAARLEIVSESMEILAQRARGIRISEDVFMAAAASSPRDGHYRIELLLQGSDRSVLTPELLEVFAKSSYSDDSMHFLLKLVDELNIAEQILEAAAGNPWYGDKLVKALIIMAPTSEISDGVWSAAAGNEGCGVEIISLLKERVGQVDITEKLLTKAASTGGPRTMEFLLSHPGCVKITEEFISNAWSMMDDMEMETFIMQILLEQTDELHLSEKFLDQAAHSSTFENFNLVWIRCQQPKVSETLIKAAAGNARNWDIFEFLLGKSGDSYIGEEILEAIVDRPEDAKDILELCVDRKLTLNITEKVLIKAARNSSTSDLLMNLLLEHAQNIAITDEIFQSAAAAGNHELLLFLSQYCGMDKDLSQWIDITNLRDAAAQRAWYYKRRISVYDTNPCEPDTDVSVVEDLLSRNTPFDLPDGNGSTPLALAAEAGNELIAKLLLDAGADPDSRDRKGRSPLFRAVSKGHFEIVVALLEKGVDINVVSTKGVGMAEKAKKGAHMRIYRLLERYAKV